jgi:hypothetical protein
MLSIPDRSLRRNHGLEKPSHSELVRSGFRSFMGSRDWGQDRCLIPKGYWRRMAMKRLLSVAFLLTLLLAVEASAVSHRSTGLVVKVNSAIGTVVLLENGHQLDLIVGRDTVLLDDRGHRFYALKALQVGDYIREECTGRENGPSIARNISVLIPAWRMLESPER